jgi:SAM-dependent methyltransferase
MAGEVAAVEEWFKHWFDKDYATVYGHRDEREAERAVAMALAQAPSLAQGPVLDLGCGAGRHLGALRRRNPLAFGLDLSRDLLAMAPPRLRPWLLRGDMRRLPLRPETLAGVCMWFTPFGYFSDEENRLLLDSLRRLLAPGGVLVLDYLNAQQVRAHLVQENVSVHAGLRVVSRRRIVGRRLEKHMTLTRLETGASRQVRESVRLYEPRELRALASQCGFAVVRECGNYDGGAFDPAGSPRWIGFLARLEISR